MKDSPQLFFHLQTEDSLPYGTSVCPFPYSPTDDGSELPTLYSVRPADLSFFIEALAQEGAIYCLFFFWFCRRQLYICAEICGQHVFIHLKLPCINALFISPVYADYCSFCLSLKHHNLELDLARCCMPSVPTKVTWQDQALRGLHLPCLKLGLC